MTRSLTAQELKEGLKSFSFRSLARQPIELSTPRFSIARRLLDILSEHASFGRVRITAKETIQPNFVAPLQGAGSQWTRSAHFDRTLGKRGRYELPLVFQRAIQTNEPDTQRKGSMSDRM